MKYVTHEQIKVQESNLAQRAQINSKAKIKIMITPIYHPTPKKATLYSPKSHMTRHAHYH